LLSISSEKILKALTAIQLLAPSPPLLFMGTYSLTDGKRGTEPMFLEFSNAAGI